MIRKMIFQKRLASLTSTFLLVLMVTSTALATTYYVSSSIGADDYNGLYGAYQSGDNGHWKTIHKINEQIEGMLPGDTICFKKGDVWNLTEDELLIVTVSGTMDYPFTITNYESSHANPLFIGSIQLVSDAECPDGNCGMNPNNPCIADLNYDMAVDGLDSIILKEDYPRTQWLGKPCPACSGAGE